MSKPAVRDGGETKEQALRVALALFTAKGFEATSLREIAEQLGISKAALYYHFKNKDDIVKAALVDRGNEAEELLAWARQQTPGPDLLERAVLRWVNSLSVDKLHGIRFVTANPSLMRRIGPDPGGKIRGGLGALADLLAGENADPTRCLLVRMAFVSINAAVMAANQTTCTDDDIICAAKEMALAIVSRLRDSRQESIEAHLDGNSK